MKLLKYLSFFLFLAALSVGCVSCGGDDDDVNLGEAPYEGLSGKYTVTTTSSQYQSIELGASGNYIIELNQNVPSDRSVTDKPERSSFLHKMSGVGAARAVNGYIIYGKYTKEGNILHLDNFGTLEIIYNGDIVVNFKLTPTGKSTVTLGIEKEQQLENEALNNQVCRTWNVLSLREIEYKNGTKIREDFLTPDNSAEDAEFPLQILISKAGTYLIYYKNGTANAAKWKWRNKTEQTFYYSWSSYWDDDSWCSFTLSGNRMTVIEDASESNNGVTSRCWSEYILEAVN